MPKIPSAIATITSSKKKTSIRSSAQLSCRAAVTSSKKKTSIRSSAQLSCRAAGQPPLTASARLTSDPVATKSGGQARLRTGNRSEALPERNQLSAMHVGEFTPPGPGRLPVSR
jgi:hypothetical protein